MNAKVDNLAVYFPSLLYFPVWRRIRNRKPEELKVVTEQLSKLKAKMPGTECVVDLFARRKKSMKDRAFIETSCSRFRVAISKADIV